MEKSIYGVFPVTILRSANECSESYFWHQLSLWQCVEFLGSVKRSSSLDLVLIVKKCSIPNAIFTLDGYNCYFSFLGGLRAKLSPSPMHNKMRTAVACYYISSKGALQLV